ncbi:hypothetical protein TNCV_813181 [Trichonephila clavipes]|nr:hypothetical protein TNCV_813181 [Trichonephila clavipes]
MDSRSSNSLEWTRGAPIRLNLLKLLFRMLISDINGTDIEIIQKFKQFVWTFPIHGLQDDSLGQIKSIVPNAQHGETFTVEKELDIFLGSGWKCFGVSETL